MKFKIAYIIKIFLLLITLCYAFPAISQTAAQLASVRVDDLNDDQIRSFIRQIESSGLTDSQLEQYAQSKGMRPEEIQKLRVRVDKVRKQDQGKTSATGIQNKTITAGREVNNAEKDSTVETNPETEAEKALLELKSKIYGASLFKTTNLTFEPNLRIATPANYMIGPEDEITVDITGDNEASYKLKVSPEGTIRIEYAGIVSVSGLSVEDASQRIKSRLSSTYPSIRSGRTNVTIGIGNIRSIKVTVLGEVVKPGSYTLPSLATAFNALYSSGGPTENGSLREIEIVRNNRVIQKLDVYDFLQKGFQTNNVRLQDQDVIRVPTYKLRVEFTGEVKRPAIFEVLSNETLSDVLNFAGGFTDQAYIARIKVLQNTERERRITDVLSKDFNAYKPLRGDKYFVEPILDRFENRVRIEGAVFRPGQFELEKGLTLATLIKKADGLTADAFLPRGYITRLKTDNSFEIISFDLNKILSGSDIPLQREDVINISSIFELREEYRVSIDGEVQQPGTFEYAENMSLEDLIMKSGGFKEGASPKRVEVSRRVKNSDILSASASTAEIFYIDVDKDLRLMSDRFVLQPFDIVSVRNATGYEAQRQVYVEGEVLYPGTYTVSRKDERISDLVKRAGGLTALAYPAGASLKRPGNTGKSSSKNAIRTTSEEKEKLQKLQRLQGITQKDSVETVKESIPNIYVGINLEKILKKPGLNYDLTLEEGDTLRVPKQLQTVKVSGQVLSPATIIYNKDQDFESYISQAGGFSDRALKRRSYIIYANGSVKSTRNFIGLTIFPQVKPGAEIFVPKKAERKGLSAVELVGISSGVASLGLIILQVVSMLK